ncbi:MAG: CPBP family intramembrane metalloprotease, partial [Gemmatimonadetes bacterium]|nr:CPBP family intramembrane metalloprotease [Gemmatimonadota bacterium]
LSGLLRWRVGGRWYAAAILMAPLAALATLALLSWATTPMVPGILTAHDKAALLVTGVSTGLLVPVFEELGWTGFATPRLLERHGVVAAGILMGLLWGAWHLPLFAGSGGAAGEVPPALFLGAMLFSWLVPYRVLMVWVYDRTRSVLLGMVMHVPIVVSQYVLNPEGISGKPLFLSLIVYSVVLWLIVAAARVASPPQAHHLLGLRRG